jgi:KaiC/GvpD/RAD55 family RecA-like ATPase
MRRKWSGLEWQEPPSRLPEELSEFLSRQTFSLLIKGGSGSGKTILALTILARMKTEASTLYLSTRTSPLQLKRDYPRITKAAGLSTVSKTEGPSEAGWETLVDARLDEPGVVFERITNVLMDHHAPTVVVDSWEALNDSMGREALRTNIRVLQTWRERAGARFIFIGEDAANTDIDSVVDGVVTLTEQALSGRRLREIVLSKLRGIQISRPTYFFSLEGGVFHSFERYRQSDFDIAQLMRGHGATGQGEDKRHVSTGFRPLDEALGGGYPLKSAAWIEVDPGVDAKVALAFLSRTVCEWAAAGRAVVFQESEALDPDGVTQLRASLRGSASGRIKVLDPGTREKKGRADGLAGLQSKVMEVKAPTLFVLDFDKIADLDASANSISLESIIDFQSGAALAILISKSKPAKHPLSGVVRTHLRIAEMYGTLFAMSEKPWSELYALVSERQSGKMNLQLERVV